MEREDEFRCLVAKVQAQLEARCRSSQVMALPLQVALSAFALEMLERMAFLDL
jgi:hypothetical protein